MVNMMIWRWIVSTQADQHYKDAKDVFKQDIKACDINTSSGKLLQRVRPSGGESHVKGWSDYKNDRRRETNRRLNLHQILFSNAITAAKSVVQSWTLQPQDTQYSKNDLTKAQSPLSNMTDGCQQQLRMIHWWLFVQSQAKIGLRLK